MQKTQYAHKTAKSLRIFLVDFRFGWCCSFRWTYIGKAKVYNYVNCKCIMNHSPKEIPLSPSLVEISKSFSFNSYELSAPSGRIGLVSLQYIASLDWRNNRISVLYSNNHLCSADQNLFVIWTQSLYCIKGKRRVVLHHNLARTIRKFPIVSKSVIKFSC